MKLTPKKKQGKAPKKWFSLSPASIFCALVLSVPTVSQAGALDSIMEGVYTNTTDSGAFKSQKMGHFQGGSYYARFPTKSINVAMFDPPRIQAGCGGIDLFGGSFSFISGDEIVQILRSIGQNALGLLFHMGIQAISQPLSTLLSHWSDKLQQMNQALRNTCAAANKLVSIVTDGPKQQDNASRQSMTKTFSGFFKDSYDAFKAGQAQARENSLWTKLSNWGSREENATANNDKNAEENSIRNDPTAGNMTWKALTNTKSYERVSDVINSKEQKREIKELIINIGGTEINNQFKKENDSSAKENCVNSSENAAQCDANPINDATTRGLTAKDLMEVSDENPKMILRCKDSDSIKHSSTHIDTDMACVEMEHVKLSEVFKGAAYYINKALFGSNATHRLTNSEIENQIANERGLIGKGLGNNNSVPTGDELFALENTSIPFLAHLFYLQVEPQEQKNAMFLVYEALVQKYAHMIGQNLLYAARGAYIGGQSKVHANKPHNYDANLEAFALELKELELPPEKEIQLNMMLNTMRQNVERNAQSRAVSNRITSNNNTK